jgi:hypothetical protein
MSSFENVSPATARPNSAAQTAKKFLTRIGAGTVKRICSATIDSFLFKAFVQPTPTGGFVRMNNSTPSETTANERGGLVFRAKHGWHRFAAAFTDNGDYLPLPVLVTGITAVAAVLFLFCWLYIAAKIPTLDFRELASAADDAAFEFVSHHLP